MEIDDVLILFKCYEVDRSCEEIENFILLYFIEKKMWLIVVRESVLNDI